MSYINLHNHTEFSALDGVGKVSEYAERAKELNQIAVGMTDHGNIDGAIKFQKACEKVGIQPVIGIEFYVVPNISIKEKGEKRAHLCAYARNETGWNNILKMVSISNVDGFFYRPRISPDIFLEHNEGLAVSTACVASIINYEWGEDFLRQIINEDLYLEVMPHIFKSQIETNIKVLELSKKYDIKMIASNDAHYVYKEDEQTQEVLLAVQSNKKWDDPARWKFDGGGYYLKSKLEMARGFREQDVLSYEEYTEAMWNTLEIADKCKNFRIEKKKISLPKIEIPDSFSDEFLFLEELCHVKLYSIGMTAIYKRRLREELSLIKRQGFEKYFLIVWELINWCNKNNIMVGPGRGSSGGSLVCYLLGITKVDPLKYNLLFSRFISPDRIDIPDIDIDFEDIKRPLIRKHLEELYGKWSVAGISTFSEMKGKGSIRDVSRVFNIPLKDVNKACLSIVTKLDGDEGATDTIADAFEMSEDGKWFREKYPEVTSIAMRLEGQIRNRGQHAAAIVIADEDLRNGDRCAFVLGKDKEPIINWDKDNIEYVGLMKLDVLGLKMLTVLNDMKKRVKENHNVDLIYEDIPLDDKKCLEEFTKGNSVGCFQVGSQGLRKFCQRLGIDDFMMLVHATSLYRPGTLRSGMADVFVSRKNGEQDIPYTNEVFDSITKDTYGIILYQEQVMRLVVELAGLDWSIADKVRKIIAKSKGEEALREYEDIFVKGCVEKDSISGDRASEIWNDVISFGGYSFNKCLSGDTILIKGSVGNASAEITIKEIYDTWRSKTHVGKKYRSKGLTVLQMKSDDRIRPGKIKGVYKNGERDTYIIKTKSGRSIRSTDNHKFMIKKNGELIYEVTKNLTIGDMMVVIGPSERSLKKSDVARYRGLGDKYNGCGFKDGEENIGFVDGRSIFLKEAKKHVFDRSCGFCEKCGEKIYKYCNECGSLIKLGRPEYAHINSIDFFGYDWKKYNSKENILFLCNSCHKKFDYDKKERKVRYTKGRLYELDEIDHIEYYGIETVYDVEMDEPDHNFIANDFVSHNSHAVEYSMITFWDMYCKIYYPVEFICSLLTYGTSDDEKKDEYIEEAFRLGLDVRPPKIGYSRSKVWVEKDGVLYAPFIEIKGIGDKTAVQFENISKESFYGENKISKRFLNILDKINADKNESLTDEEADRISDYLGISLVKNRLFKYKKLVKLLNSQNSFVSTKEFDANKLSIDNKYIIGIISEIKLKYKNTKDGKIGTVYGTIKDDKGYLSFVFSAEAYEKRKQEIETCEDQMVIIAINVPRREGNIICNNIWFNDEIMSCDLEGLDIEMYGKARYCNEELLQCDYCKLRNECKSPVLPSPGSSNLMIIGEAPSRNEDNDNYVFVGDVGNVLWNEMNGYRLSRREFYCTHFIKCYPSNTKTPQKEHIESCREWLEGEIKEIKPSIVLAFGNTAIKFFTDEESGIMKKNGLTEWNERYGFWVCWCIHPASVLHHAENLTLFSEGVKNFVEKSGIIAF